MAVVVLFYSVRNPGIELDLSIVLQLRTHRNGSDAARDASVKNHYCYRAFTQTLITHRAFTDTDFIKTKLQSRNSTLPVRILELEEVYGHMIALSQSAAPRT
jgi:hypothetical protein